MQQNKTVISMGDENWAEVKDIAFLHESGVSPEKIAKVKKISIEKVNRILGNLDELVAKRKKMNIVQDIGNQNPWKEELPPEEILDLMAERLEAEDRQDGARTVPSRPIAAVDRSDRVGEDRKMVDRLAGEEAASKVSKPLKEVVEAATIEQRIRSRKDWDETISDVSEMLDDDLDL